MSANHYIDKERQLIITTWEGKASDVDFIEAINKYQNEIQNHPDYIHFNEIVNLTKVTGYKLTTEGIKTIGQIASSTDKSDLNRKLAIIVNTSLAYGLARMYVTYRGFTKKGKKEINIFKVEKDAFEWVQNKSPQETQI